VEFSSTTNIEYLGHSIGLRSMTMKPSVVGNIKSHIQNLLFSNLVREPLYGTQAPQRIHGGLDRDYITFVWQLRRYLYGPLSEQQVRRFQNGQIPPMSFEGLMSFFPLVDDDEILLDLDQWISAQTWLAVRKRSLLLRSGLAGRAPKMWDFSRERLIGYRDVSTSTGSAIDLRLPSVRRIASVVRKAIQIYGSGVVGSGSRLYMYET
jgi:RNA-directed DNA polymerase